MADHKKNSRGRSNRTQSQDKRRSTGYSTKPQVRYVRRANAPRRKFSMPNRVKLIIVFSILIAAMAALIVRLFYINMTKGDKYAKIVLSQMNYDGQQIPFRRGDIVDRNGTVLATSEKVYNLVIDSYVMLNSKVNQDGDCLEPTLKVLGDCFGSQGLIVDEIRSFSEENPDNRYNVVLKHLSYEDLQTYNDFMAVDEDGYYVNKEAAYVKGIWFEEEYVRKYPYGNLAGDVLGFTNSGNIGAAGLEAYYNDELNGTNGREYGYLSDDGILERSVVSPTNGQTLVLTMDINVQQIIHKVLYEFNEALGSLNSAVIVQKADTGEILGMESYPFLDPNDPYDISDYVSEERWNTMTDEEKMKERQAIWRNFCVTDTYEPGSTVKTVTVASALDNGIVTPDSTFDCDGGRDFRDGSGTVHVSCVKTTGHGRLTLSETLEYSCNDALMEIGLREGQELFVKTWSDFGLGLKTNIDLPGESSGIIKNASMSDIDLAICSFGQTYTTTMVQVASTFASIVNGGNYYRPHMVSEIRAENGSVVQTFDKELVRTTVSGETSEWMLGALENTVSNESASGHRAYIEGYKIGGKTGTAEKYPRRQRKHLVSFISCAPTDDPEVIVYVVIDEPSTQEGADSKLPTIMTRKIYEELLPYLQIFPEGGTVEDETDETEPTADAMTGADGTQEPEESDESESDTQESESDTQAVETDANGETISGEADNFEEQANKNQLSDADIARIREEYLPGGNYYREREYIRE